MSTNEERTQNRTERLFALVLLLQNRPNMTSRDLAEHFGVSRRTIFRDIRALEESGVPLSYADGGGYEILEGYQLPPLMLTAREAATLLIGTEFMRRQTDPSLMADAREVALKIRATLPTNLQDYIDTLSARIVIDPYWFQTMHEADPESGFFHKLSKAVTEQWSLHLQYYVASRDELTRRLVDPLGLIYYTDHWTVVAYDHTRDDYRNFRVDRIRNIIVTSQRFEQPEDFDLAEYLEERGSMDAHEIVLTFDQEVYPLARRSIPATIDEEVSDDETTTVTFSFENLDYLAHWLLRYGQQAQVVAPQTLQERVRSQALAIATLYEAS